MKKTYITTLPDHVGAFLKANKCFADLGINIERVSYNKAIDTHTLFLDAEGTPEQLQKADEELKRLGYLQEKTGDSSIVLLEFKIGNGPGSAANILALVAEHDLNISYMNYQEFPDDYEGDYQLFKVGLYVDGNDRMAKFLAAAEEIAVFKILEYDRTEKVYDNSIFYTSFVHGLSESLGLTQDKKDQLMVNANLAMQMLDDKGTLPYRTFDIIGKFADHIAASRGAAFSPRITKHKITENTEITLIEPPCGSNTAIIRSFGEILFVDTGYAIYKEEMEEIFRREIENYDELYKRVFLTHADLDHTGLVPYFDEAYATQKTANCLYAEYVGSRGYRDHLDLHVPYLKICKILTGYNPPHPEKIKAMWGRPEPQEALLEQVGFFKFGELEFEVYEGQGGHIPGETILIDYTHHIAFTGDVYINIKGQTSEQRIYNQYAPVLMMSVDTDPKLCALERQAIMQRLGAGKWQIFGAHGYKKDYEVITNV